jgi:hypothetical protein
VGRTNLQLDFVHGSPETLEDKNTPGIRRVGRPEGRNVVLKSATTD